MSKILSEADLIHVLADLMPDKIHIYTSTKGHPPVLKYLWKCPFEVPVQIEGPYAGITLYAVLEYVRTLPEEQQKAFNEKMEYGILWQDELHFENQSACMAVETLLEIS